MFDQGDQPQRAVPSELVTALRALATTAESSRSPSKETALGAAAKLIAIPFCFDGGGVAILAGAHVYLPIPFPCRINGWEILTDLAGTVTFTVSGCSAVDFPSLTSIVASAPPTLVGVRQAIGQVADVLTWTRDIPRGTRLDGVVTSTNGVVTVMTLSIIAKRLDL